MGTFTGVLCRIVRLAVIVLLVLGGLKLVSQQPAAAKTAWVPTRLAVVDGGTAGKPDVILLPGLGSARSVWDGEASRLAPNFRLHLVQVNGFAGQPAGPNAADLTLLPDLVAELHAYIVANGMHPDVIGHSLGGTLTLMLEEKHPADVNKAVIVDALPFISALNSPDATMDKAKPVAAGLKAQITSASPEQFQTFAQGSEGKMVRDPATLKLIIASSVASDRAVFAEAIAEDITTDLRGDVAGIKIPTLLLYPYDASLQGPDPAKVEELYTAQYRTMPNVRLVRINDARHFIMYDQPAQFDDAVEAFLR